MLNVSFTTEETDVVEFNQDGDVSAHYNIMNFQDLGNNTFDYVHIGDWNNHTLHLFKPLQPPPTGIVKSVCSDPCSRGYYKVYIVINIDKLKFSRHEKCTQPQKIPHFGLSI